MMKRRIEARLKRLAHCGPLVAASINRIEKEGGAGKVQVSYLLTFREKGKTKSVYVPKDMVAEVKQWIAEYRQLKTLVAEISQLGMALIRRYVPEKRAAGRAQGK